LNEEIDQLLPLAGVLVVDEEVHLGGRWLDAAQVLAEAADERLIALALSARGRRLCLAGVLRRAGRGARSADEPRGETDAQNRSRDDFQFGDEHVSQYLLREMDDLTWDQRTWKRCAGGNQERRFCGRDHQRRRERGMRRAAGEKARA